MNKLLIRSWRVINLILIGLGLVLPWIKFNIDDVGLTIPPAGWKFIFLMWRGIIIDFYKYGFELEIWPLLIISFFDFLLIIYLIFNFLAVVKIRNHKSNKVISIFLIGTIITSLLIIYIGGKPFLGYYLTNLGIFSSAVLEWRNW
jgi:hypothetical protein